jgi:hypothetical protein
MLYTDPVPRDPPTEENKYARVFEKPDRDAGYDVQGFHWGGLTAGNWRTVFWILLAPFLLANVAGWTPRRNSRWGVALVRIAGLALTALIVSQAVIAAVLLPNIWLERNLDWQTATVRRVFGLLLLTLVAGLFLVLVRAASRSHFDKSTPESRLRRMLVPKVATMLAHPDDMEGKASPDAEWNDPAGTTLTDPAIWGAHAILYRLRRLHLGIGLTTVAMAAAIWAGSVWLLAVGVWVFAVIVFLIGGTSFWPRNRSVLWLTAVSSLASLLLAVAGLAAIAFSDSPGIRGDQLHVLTFGITVVLGVAAMATVLSAGLRTVGALVIASQLGAVLGIAIGVIVEQLLGVGPILIPNGAGWVAVAMLFLLATLLITSLILSALPTPRVGQGGFETLLRRIVLRAPVVFRVAGVFGIAFGILALVMSVRASAMKAGMSGIDDLFSLAFARRFFDGFTPEAMGVPKEGGTVEIIALVVGVLLVVILTVRLAVALSGWKKLIAFVVPAGAVGLWYASAAGLLRFSFFGLGFDLQRNLVAIAVVVTVLIPGVFMISSIVRGVREGEERRRQVGILWDIGSFWPRWFHPLAPPGYGPKVVEALVTELEESDAELLAAHSQGTLIAAVALSQMDETELPRSFITFGSQLGSLYPGMFPAAGVDLVVSEVQRRLDGRWINLWRNDDPIGGHFVESLGGANWQVCSGHGHSGHEVTVEYATARSQILAGSTAWPAETPRPPCWEAREP